jgi:hypothetical protein
MASKIYFLAQFCVLSKTEKSRRVTESRLVCVGLYTQMRKTITRQITIGIAFKDIKEVCYGT